MKIIKSIKYICCCSLISFSAYGDDFQLKGLTINMIRTVGDYKIDTTYDNTIELWFSVPIAWPSGSGCTETRRVYVDANNKHMVSASYMAFAADKTVNVTVDNTLPIRGGTCELSILDINR